MRFILLIGAAFNLCSAVPLILSAMRTLSAAASRADQFLPLTLFSAGTAVVFAGLYLYLFFYPTFVVPFLIFGASLKTWAFLLTSYLYLKNRVSRPVLLQLGIGNGAVAVLFWVYIFSNV